jgi:hypothetical protein
MYFQGLALHENITWEPQYLCLFTQVHTQNISLERELFHIILYKLCFIFKTIIVKIVS